MSSPAPAPYTATPDSWSLRCLQRGCCERRRKKNKDKQKGGQRLRGSNRDVGGWRDGLRWRLIISLRLKMGHNQWGKSEKQKQPGLLKELITTENCAHQQPFTGDRMRRALEGNRWRCSLHQTCRWERFFFLNRWPQSFPHPWKKIGQFHALNSSWANVTQMLRAGANYVRSLSRSQTTAGP